MNLATNTNQYSWSYIYSMQQKKEGKSKYSLATPDAYLELHKRMIPEIQILHPQNEHNSKTTYIQNPCTSTTFNITLHYKVNERAFRMYIAHLFRAKKPENPFSRNAASSYRPKWGIKFETSCSYPFPGFSPTFLLNL